MKLLIPALAAVLLLSACVEPQAPGRNWFRTASPQEIRSHYIQLCYRQEKIPTSTLELETCLRREIQRAAQQAALGRGKHGRRFRPEFRGRTDLLDTP